MPTIHLVEGPVGAGKSTHAAGLSRQFNAPRLILDEWMVVLFRPDRPQHEFMTWYENRKHRCIEQIWRVAGDILDTGSDVVLELGLVQQVLREDFYQRVDATGFDLQVWVVDAPREVRRERVRARNREQGATYQMEVSDEIFDLADAAWQPPDDREETDRIIHHVASHAETQIR